MMEDAYRSRDVDAVVAAKDFTREAVLMFSRPPLANLAADAELIAQAASTLELAFRAELSSRGIPDMAGTQSAFSDAAPYSGTPGVVVVTEFVKYPDGQTSRQDVLVAETSRGWRVLVPLERR
jgi:hypothetical protein